MLLTIGIGYYGYYDGMNITFIIYWGMLSFINGLFDGIRVVELACTSPVPMLSKDLPLDIRVANAVLIAVPLVELLGCPLACSLYQDYMESATMMEPIAGFRVGAVGGGAGMGLQGDAVPARTSQGTAFQGFQGTPYRLGDD